MYIYFYTEFDSFVKLENGEPAIVWIKERTENDLHISLDTDKYQIDIISKQREFYKVTKKSFEVK